MIYFSRFLFFLNIDLHRSRFMSDLSKDQIKLFADKELEMAKLSGLNLIFKRDLVYDTDVLIFRK